MGKPCGCAGSCGCDIRGRNGVRVSGSGIAPDTMWIELDASSPTTCATIMDCVGANLGNGLIYNSALRRLSARISNTAGNLISFAPDGGLLVTGGGGGGGAGGQTVANLPAGTNAIIGSSWGAGSCLWPEGVREAIEAASNMVGTAIRMVHLPLRVSSDLMPICLAEPNMSWYLQDGISQSPRNTDHREHSNAIIAPSGNPPAAEGGYFGFYQRLSQGTPTLGEALRLLARRAVLAIEVRDSVIPIESADRVKELAPQYDATSSIIVLGEPIPSSGAPGPTIIEAVSASMSGSGIPVGIIFRTRQQVIDYPPSRLATLGVTWVFVAQQLVDTAVANHVSTEVTAYRTAGLNVMLHDVHRQHQSARAAALQLRGSLCTDPLYAYGASSLYRYRRDTPSWNWAAPNVGQHSPYSDSVVGQQAHFRGFVVEGFPNTHWLGGDLHNPEQVEPYPSGYWLLPGELMPLRNADTYAVHCWWKWNNNLPSDRTRWAGLWLDAPTDRSLRDGSAATAQTIGYLFAMTPGPSGGFAQFTLTEYDGTPGTPPPARVLGTWNVPYTVSPNIYYGMRAEVTPTAIRLYAGTLSWPNPFNKVLIATINNPHRYISGVNNGYVFYGRHFFFDSDGRQMNVAGLTTQYSGF